jgi:glyoxylase I family protein
MEKVLGIGGLFFRSPDPERLARWYAEHLGVDPVPQDYDTPPGGKRKATTVFAPFPADTDYFGDQGRQWMINFRVRDLDAMIAQLEAAGIEVTLHPEPQPNGRFARLIRSGRQPDRTVGAGRSGGALTRRARIALRRIGR